MSKPSEVHALTREQLVAVFSQWSAYDIKLQRDGKVDAQAQTERFIDTAAMLFGSETFSIDTLRFGGDQE